MKDKARLDHLLCELKLAPDLREAAAMVRIGRVLIKGEPVTKPGTMVERASSVIVKGAEKYVSRGGLKLESALEAFQIRIADRVCMDVGSSTGGFTDCLLQNCAARVYAVDVGKGLLDWKLRNDLRVIVIEQFNARFLSPKTIPEKIQVAAADVSFISLAMILPGIKSVLDREADVMALVKPQFELEARFTQKGVVRDEALQLQAVEQAAKKSRETGFIVLGQTKAKIKGPKGNQEYFLHLRLETT